MHPCGHDALTVGKPRADPRALVAVTGDLHLAQHDFVVFAHHPHGGIIVGCEKAKDQPAAPSAPPPVVRQAPVETHPFEDGYNTGYALALTKATREAKLPKAADIEPLAREQAGEIPERTERWQRGFVEGYTDGFRKVVTGQK